MHADVRHCTEPSATASSTRYPLSRFSEASLARRLKIPGRWMYVAGSGVDPGVIRLELLVSDVERLRLVGRLLRF